MKLRTAAVAGLGLAIALNGTAAIAGAAEVDEAPVRLLVADNEAAELHVIDAATGEHLAHAELTGAASLYSGPTGRYGYAVQRDAGLTNIVDSGVEIEDHGDHVHIHVHEPSVLPFALESERPTHWVSHGGQVAIFNDGDGTVSLFDEADLANGEPPVTTMGSGAAHHGVAVPWGDVVLVTTPSPVAGDLPIGVDVRSLDGTVLQSFPDCPGLHGEASAGEDIAFGCSDGVLVLRHVGDGFVAIKAPNPADAPEGVRVGTVRGAEGVAWFMGNWGPTGLALIDPEAGALAPITVPDGVVSFAVIPSGELLVLTAAGNLDVVDPTTGTVTASAAVAAPVDLDSTDPRPAFATGGGHAYVVDPAGERVVRVRLDGLAIDGEIAVEGTPVRIAVLAAVDPLADDDHDHDHDGNGNGDHDDGDHDDEAVTASYAFTGQVTEGPSMGTVLGGQLDLTVAADGHLTGTLALEGAEATVRGEVLDGNVSLAIELGELRVFGIGRTASDGALVGSFVGPGTADCGIWTATLSA